MIDRVVDLKIVVAVAVVAVTVVVWLKKVN